MYAFTEHHGYPLFDVISAYQKDIRRGNERQAMYWALELMPRYELYLWRRTLAILHEDIGLGAPHLLASVPEMRRLFFEYRENGKNGPARLVLANTILSMCRAPKTRMADHFQRCVAQEFMDDPKHEIPDYALDHHTSAGKRMGRDVDFWLAEGCQLNLSAEVEDPYQEEAEAHWRAGHDAAPEWPKRARGNSKRSKNDESQLKLF